MATTTTHSERDSLPLWKKGVVVCSMLFGLGYYGWRALFTINPEQQAYSWIFLVAELIGFGSTATFVLGTFRLRRRESRPIKSTPSVDVFITTYNEAADVVAASIYHCVNMEYPHTTYVLDDGARPEIEKLALGLGARYIRRYDNAHAKAGNVNNALKHTHGDVIALFDADGVPHRQFLTRLLGYFEDAQVALVQTPQSFYNLDSFQHVNDTQENTMWHEQSLFFDVIQCGRDYHEAAMWCGSGSLFRRSAIEKLGGVSVGTVTEDLHTTLDLHVNGYRSIYHREALAFCLAPASVSAYVVQRARWGLGCVQVFRREWRKILFSRTLNFYQRLSYVPFYYLSGIQRAVFFVAPFLFLVFGIAPVQAPDLFVVAMLSNMVLALGAYYALARGRGRLYATEVFNLFTLWSYLKSIVLGFTGLKLPFKVTSKDPGASVPWLLLVPVLAVTLLSAYSVARGARDIMQGARDLGTFTASLFAFHYLAVGIGALNQARRRPVSEEAYSFFDYRPLHVKSIDGAVPISRSMGIAVVISEKMLRFIFVHELKVGARLSIDLDLPDAELSLETEVVSCERKKVTGQEKLFEVELRYVERSDQNRFELIRYFFEDATPRIFAKLAIERPAGPDLKLVNQRRGVRLPSLLPVFVQPHDGVSSKHELQIGLAVELSATNARLKLPAALPVGQLIRLQIPWMGKTIVAKVARCLKESGQINPPYDIGLIFDGQLELENELETAELLKNAANTTKA